MLYANHGSNNNKFEELLDKNDELNSFEEITNYNNYYEL
jgi:hypothetical protein